MPSIRTAYEWSILKCNDPNVGYSQQYRNEQMVDGITYYDCSSFVWFALLAGGFDVVAAYNSCYGGYYGNAMTTAQMDTILTWLGFSRYDALNTPWADGDIMWRSGHTEFVYNASMYYCMGAHSDEYPLADQVSISTVSTRNYWTYGYRYAPNFQWYAQPTQGYLRGSDEAYSNAVMICRILMPRGWTLNAISAMLANIEYEGGYNPWRWESDIIVGTMDMGSYDHGYGLFQFTPANKYINPTTEANYPTFNPNYLYHSGSPEDGDAQIKWMDDEPVTQWYPTQGYWMTFAEFKVSTSTPEYLASCWMRDYERPRSYSTEYDRQVCARYWYNKLQDIPPEPPTPPTPPTPPAPPFGRRKSPFWVYIYPF